MWPQKYLYTYVVGVGLTSAICTVRSPLPNLRPPTGTIWVHIHSTEFSPNAPIPSNQKETHSRTQFSASQWAKLATDLYANLWRQHPSSEHTLFWVAGNEAFWQGDRDQIWGTRSGLRETCDLCEDFNGNKFFKLRYRYVNYA